MSRESEAFIASKYARAFIGIFSEEIDYSQIINVEKFVLFLQNQKEAFFYFKLPLISDQIKSDVFAKLISQFQLSKSFLVLINLLIREKRIHLICSILKCLVKLVKNTLGIMDFTITSSHAMRESELSKIINFLQEKTRKKIEYKTKIDSNLIAGLKIHSDSLGWEYSIYDQLKLLARR